MLDDEGYGTTVLVVDGTERPDAVIDVVERVAESAEVAGASAIVVATVRPATASIDERGAASPHTDVNRWLEASDVAADHGIELLEWFVVGPGGVVCPREVFGEPERWPRPA